MCGNARAFKIMQPNMVWKKERVIRDYFMIINLILKIYYKSFQTFKLYQINYNYYI